MSLPLPYFTVMLILIVFSLWIPDIEVYENNGLKVRNWKSYRLLFLIMVLTLAVFCAFKSISAASIDEYAYRNRFFRYQGYSFVTAIEEAGGEYIHSILMWITSKVFTDSQGVFIVFGSLTAFFYLLSMIRYGGNFTFAVALLMCMGIVNTSFNITQQCLGCAVYAAFFLFLCDRRPIPYFLLVLCCLFIHGSALFLIPLYFCSDRQDRDVRIKPYILLIAFVLLIIYSNLSVLAARMPMLARYTEQAESWDGISTNVITVMINCVPAIVTLVLKNRIDEDDRITRVAGNMCLVHAAVFAAALLDNYIARLALYTIPFCAIFLSRSVRYIDERIRKSYMITAVLLYSIELFLRIRGHIYTFNFVF